MPYHRTCRHAAEGIDSHGGILQPTPQPLLGRVPMLWFTTIASASRAALGLSSLTLACDRMERLYRVIPADEHLLIRWGDLKMAPQFEAYLPAVRRLEAVRGTRPGLWLVALDPVRVEPC